MNKTEATRAIKAALPKDWKLEKISVLSKRDPSYKNEKYIGSFTVTCPVEDRFNCSLRSYMIKVNKIARAVNAECAGGGCFIDAPRYDNFFCIKKPKAEKQ